MLLLRTLAVQAPIMLPDAQALGADAARVVMAVAWCNLIQPFLGIASAGNGGLKSPGYYGFLFDVAV